MIDPINLDALAAHVERLRKALSLLVRAVEDLPSASHDADCAVARDPEWLEDTGCSCALADMLDEPLSVLASTPTASLAAHDAAVLEEAADAFEFSTTPEHVSITEATRLWLRARAAAIRDAKEDDHG